jgi:predicted RNA-binding Zn-ribbon protein involved in translation (DUF1610 family)
VQSYIIHVCMYIEIIIKWDDKLWNKKLDVDLSRTISTYVNNIVRVVYVYMACTSTISQQFRGVRTNRRVIMNFMGGKCPDLWVTIIRMQDKRPFASTYKCKCGLFALPQQLRGDGQTDESLELYLFFIFKKR